MSTEAQINKTEKPTPTDVKDQGMLSLAWAAGNGVLSVILTAEIIGRVFQIPGNRTDHSLGFKILPVLMLVFPWVNILAAVLALFAARRPRLLAFTKYVALSGGVCAVYLAIAMFTYY